MPGLSRRPRSTAASPARTATFPSPAWACAKHCTVWAYTSELSLPDRCAASSAAAAASRARVCSPRHASGIGAACIRATKT